MAHADQEQDARAERLKEFASKYRTAISSSTATIFSTTIGYPLDSVKTRMQTYKYSSLWNCIKYTHQTEGLRGFFRGLWIPLCSVTAIRTTSFTVYESSKMMFARNIFGEDAIAPKNIDPYCNMPLSQNALVSFVSGFVSGSFISAFAAPLEFAKLSMQIEIIMATSLNPNSPQLTENRVPIKPRGTVRAIQDILVQRGVKGLYSAFPYNLARDALGTGLYFCSYETVKRILSPTDGGSPSPVVYAISGALCGAASWCLVFPIDTAKSIVQRDILRSKPGDGYVRRSFLSFNWLSGRMYRGIWVSLLRSAIINSVNFSIYELMKKAIHNQAG